MSSNHPANPAVAETVEPLAGAAPQAMGAEVGGPATGAAIERLNEAVSALRTMAIQPLLNRALAALRADDAQGAAELAIKALQQDERQGLGWYILAVAREKINDFRSSIQCFEKALELLPDQVEIANDIGRLAFRLGEKTLAVKLFAHYCAAVPGSAQGANNLACALRDLHDYEGAVRALQAAIAANPEDSMLWNTLGTVLGDQGLPEKSLVFFEEALRLTPQFAKARYNLGNTRLDLGDPVGALADCDAAIRISADPADLAMMHLARSSILLCQGRVAEGWAEYESRLDPASAMTVRFAVERGLWTPDQDLKGRRLLLMGEQGLGDEVLFGNLIPDLIAELGDEAYLSLVLETRLVPLFQRSFPRAHVSAHATAKIDGHTYRSAPAADWSQVDLWAPMASLLRRFRPTIESFPTEPGFLTPDPQRVAHWRAWLDTLPGPRVGLLWKSLKLDGARLKQFSPFEQWAPVLATPGVSFVNLQYGDCQDELAQAREALGVTIWQPPGIDLKQDLDDLAALCAAMDLIIGPSNATTNIAGACAAPIWLISPPSAWPRLGADRYAWYPTTRLFIAKGFNRWAELMPEVAEALAAFAAGCEGAN